MWSLESQSGDFVKPICVICRIGNLFSSIIRNKRWSHFWFGFTTINAHAIRTQPKLFSVIVCRLHKAWSIQHFIRLWNILNRCRTGILYFCRTTFTSFRRYDNHTVTGTCTINSSRTCILQYFDRFYIVRVNWRQDIILISILILVSAVQWSRIAHWKTIDNDQRIIPSLVWRGSTADTESRLTSRLCTDRTYLQTGSLTS